MAVVYQDEEDKDKGANEDGGKTLGTESAVINPTEAPPAAANSASGAYTNLQSYLDANKGNNQAQNVAEKVGQTADEATAARDQASNSFKSVVDKENVKEDPSLFDKIKNNPLEVDQNEAEKAAFTKMRTAIPGQTQSLSDDFSDYVNAQSKEREAEEAGAATQSEAGRKSLLGKYYGRPDYTEGQKNLDQLLVQNDPGANEAFNAAKAKTDSGIPKLNSLKDELYNYAKDARDATGLANQHSNDLISGLQTGMQNDINPRYNQALQAKQAAYDQAQAQLQKGQISKSLADKAGLSGSSVQDWGINPESYFKSVADPTLNQFASKDEYAKYNALSDLGGQQNTYLPLAEQAGAYDPSNYGSFDTKGFNTAIAGQKSLYDELLNRKIFNPTGSVQNGNAGIQGGAPQNVIQAPAPLKSPGGGAFGGVGSSTPVSSDPSSILAGDYGLVGGSLQDNLNYVQNNMKNDPRWKLEDTSMGPAAVGRYNQMQQVYNNLRAKYGADKALEIIGG